MTSFPYDINCVSVAPDGSKVLVDWQYVPHNRGKGPVAYNLDFTTTGSPWPVKNDATHWCWAQMRNGDLAVVSQNNETDRMQVCDVATGEKYNIMAHKSMGWNCGFHFFNTGKPGWAGMYTISTPNSHSSWAYDQIYLIELKADGRIFRVTFSQHIYKGDYFDEGHAQMDWHLTGTKLWFNSNWRGISNAEVYRVDLPEHWYEDLEGLPYTVKPQSLPVKDEPEPVVQEPQIVHEAEIADPAPVPAVPLPAPSELYVSSVSVNSVVLSWKYNSDNKSGFKIERKEKLTDSYTQIGTVSPNITTFADTGLAPMTRYFYRVKAYNADSDSEYSNETSTFTRVAVPVDPFDTIAENEAAIVISSGIKTTETEYRIKIYFKGKYTGTYECRIFALTGEQAWYDAKDDIKSGVFDWAVKNPPVGEYVAVITGPDMNIKKKALIFK